MVRGDPPKKNSEIESAMVYWLMPQTRVSPPTVTRPEHNSVEELDGPVVGPLVGPVVGQKVLEEPDVGPALGAPELGKILG